ncbi:MAG: ABC transporter ATP-binding protein, partial [Chloroflexi bacterium]|nr:ABC transporter ATP-binding protein [Chloroflexota bacterium]
MSYTIKLTGLLRFSILVSMNQSISQDVPEVLNDGIIHDPLLLLLDEPTLGVDIQLRTMIFEYLVDLNARGTTILYTTHYMKEAESLCSRVNIIDHGE